MRSLVLCGEHRVGEKTQPLSVSSPCEGGDHRSSLKLCPRGERWGAPLPVPRQRPPASPPGHTLALSARSVSAAARP